MDLFDHAAMNSHPFPLQRGIPVPTSREISAKASWERPDFGFERLEVGDSFDVWPHQCGNEALIVVQNTVSGAAATFRKKGYQDRRFTTRQMQGQFVRCWRVE
jgi:hypothetical protein